MSCRQFSPIDTGLTLMHTLVKEIGKLKWLLHWDIVTLLDYFPVCLLVSGYPQQAKPHLQCVALNLTKFKNTTPYHI